MIRINLLPAHEATHKGAGQKFLLLMAIVLLAQAAVLFYVQSDAEDQLRNQQQANSRTEVELNRLREITKEIAILEEEKADLEAQKIVLDGLIEGKSGPVRVLYALAQVMARSETPEQKIVAQNLGWNPDWDPKTLWLESLVEQGRRVQLSGIARSNEDLAQFLRRMSSSRHFVNVELKITEAFPIRELGDARFVRFDIEAVALYGPGDVQKLAAGTLFQSQKNRRR